MVLTKPELIDALKNEVRILLHLAGQIDRNQLDYKPTPKHRSTIELLRYLAVMGPMIIPAVKAGAFDVPAWQAANAEVAAMNFDQVLGVIAKQSSTYETLVSSFSEDDFRGEIDLFGRGFKSSRGSVIVNLVLGGHAAYRTQLFCYLKSCGRDELNTMNLWGGMDAAMPATV